MVDSVRIGVPCRAVACPSDYYIGHSSVAADDDGGLYFAYDGALRAGTRQRTWLRTSDDGGDTWSPRIARLRATRAVRVPDGGGDGVG